eukprot:317496-Alexandrium_andersonii.AAC.1
MYIQSIVQPRPDPIRKINGYLSGAPRDGLMRVLKRALKPAIATVRPTAWTPHSSFNYGRRGLGFTRHRRVQSSAAIDVTNAPENRHIPWEVPKWRRCATGRMTFH